MPDSVEESPVVTEEKKVEEEEEKEVNPKKPQDEQEEEEGSGGDRSLLNTSHDPYYPPIITLPEVVVNSGEEEEDEILKLRAKLFRYDTSDPEEPPVWKERGTGDVKILKHQETSQIRLLMRRDKTLKICANHKIQPHMVLKANCGSDRAFVWSVQADFADDEAKPEVLAIRFSNAENAKKFKFKFEEAVKAVTSAKAKEIKDEEGKLSEMVKKVDIGQEESKE